MLVLEGINVLDLLKLAPGPFCTMIFGDLGANVVNIGVPLKGSSHSNIMRQTHME
jgi:alpha-methylacyl-CoA racemase